MIKEGKKMIEAKILAQIVELSNQDCKKLLQRVGYGHLGCALHNRPYVVPIHYAFDDPYLYFFTTEGKKTDIIAENAEVCLQVEDVTDSKHWQSVMVTGEAERLTATKELDHAIKLIQATNPTLSPAWSIRWMDMWIRKNISAVYRITPLMITGRTTVR